MTLEIFKIVGSFPVIGEGRVNGMPFFFRAR